MLSRLLPKGALDVHPLQKKYGGSDPATWDDAKRAEARDELFKAISADKAGKAGGKLDPAERSGLLRIWLDIRRAQTDAEAALLAEAEAEAAPAAKEQEPAKAPERKRFRFRTRCYNSSSYNVSTKTHSNPVRVTKPQRKQRKSSMLLNGKHHLCFGNRFRSQKKLKNMKQRRQLTHLLLLQVRHLVGLNSRERLMNARQR